MYKSYVRFILSFVDSLFPPARSEHQVYGDVTPKSTAHRRQSGEGITQNRADVSLSRCDRKKERVEHCA